MVLRHERARPIPSDRPAHQTTWPYLSPNAIAYGNEKAKRRGYPPANGEQHSRDLGSGLCHAKPPGMCRTDRNYNHWVYERQLSHLLTHLSQILGVVGFCQ
jgi:hypothetical protein